MHDERDREIGREGPHLSENMFPKMSSFIASLVVSTNSSSKIVRSAWFTILFIILSFFKEFGTGVSCTHQMSGIG